MASMNIDIDNVNQRDEQNRTLLHNSVFENNLDAVKKLLQNGADASLTSNEGNTPLHSAASRKLHKIVETLLKYSSREKVRKFIDAKTTESGSGGSTPLHIAASSGCYESVRHLLSYGANFEVKKKNGKRPVDVATEERVKKLLANVETDWKLAAQGNYKMLQYRLYQYTKAELKASVSARNNDGMTSLQMAVINNHCNTVYRLVEIRVDRLQDDYVITDENVSMDEFIEHGKSNSEHQSSLMLHSQDVNMMDGETMADEVGLILLAAYNIVKIAEKVFKPINGEPYEQSSLLAVVEETLDALQFKPGHVIYNKAKKVIFRGHKARYYKMLRINDGENEDYDDSEDKDKIISYMGILQVAITRAIAMFMRQIFMVKMSVAAKDNDLEMFEKCIEEQFIDPDIVHADADRRTPLHYAAENGNEKMIKLLLKKGAIINVQCKANKETALHLAANKGHVEAIRTLLQNIRDMSDLKTFVDMKTSNEGRTAVHFAAKTGQLDVLKCLLEFGATYDLQDKAGKTPCDLSENVLVTRFLKGIVELFQMAKNGDASLLKKLRALKSNELLAIGHACNSSGYTIKNVAEMKGHRALASQVAKMVKKVTPAPPEPEGQDADEAYHEIEMYQLMETLNRAMT